MILFKRKIILAGLAFLLNLALFSGVHQGFVDVGTFQMKASQVNDPFQNQTRNPK